MPMEKEDRAYAAGCGLFVVLPACLGAAMFGGAAVAAGGPVAAWAIVGGLGGAGVGAWWTIATWDETTGRYLTGMWETISEPFREKVQESETVVLLSDKLEARHVVVNLSSDSHYGSTAHSDPQGSPYSLFSIVPPIPADSDEEGSPPNKPKKEQPENSSDEGDLPPPHKPEKKLLKAEDRRPNPASTIGASDGLHLQSVVVDFSDSRDGSINSNPQQSPPSLFSMGAAIRCDSVPLSNKPQNAPPKPKADERRTDPGSIFAHPPLPLTMSSDPIPNLMLPAGQKRIRELQLERSERKQGKAERTEQEKALAAQRDKKKSSTPETSTNLYGFSHRIDTPPGPGKGGTAPSSASSKKGSGF